MDGQLVSIRQLLMAGLSAAKLAGLLDVALVFAGAPHSAVCSWGCSQLRPLASEHKTRKARAIMRWAAGGQVGWRQRQRAALLSGLHQ